MMAHEQTETQDTVHNGNRRLGSKTIVVAVLLLIVFLVSFVPQYAKSRRLSNELQQARQENSLAQIRDLAALVYFQTSQKNYGLAAETSARFFNRTRELANQTREASGRKSLADLTSFQDPVTAGLAKGDPGVLNDVQRLFVKTREATMPSAPGTHSE